MARIACGPLVRPLRLHNAADYAAIGRPDKKGADVLSWLLWQLDRIDRIQAAARALMSELGVEAYAEARRREREASSNEIAKDWSRVALAVAHKMRRRVGVYPSTRIAMNALFVPDREAAAAKPQMFRIQFVCAAPDRGPTNLKEVQIQAADTSAAIVAAANTVWPPRTIGLRILDREGREVFTRQKAERRQIH